MMDSMDLLPGIVSLSIEVSPYIVKNSVKRHAACVIYISRQGWNFEKNVQMTASVYTFLYKMSLTYLSK